MHTSSATRSADLCWGQRYLWLRHHQLPPHARHDGHIVVVFELPPGVPATGVPAALDRLVGRHEALRTTYHPEPDGPRQRVHPPGTLPLITVTVERDGTPGPADILERLSLTEFDLTNQWPIRACMITAGDQPKRLILVLHQLAVDATTVDRLEAELECLGAALSAGQPAILDPVAYQPADLARYQCAPAAVAAKDRALAYWRDEIARLPADPLRRRRRPDPTASAPPAATATHAATVPTAYSATLTSPALLAAARLVASRYAVAPVVVHLATYAMVMAGYTGDGRVTHLSFPGRPEPHPYADVLTSRYAPLLMHVQCPDDPTFGELSRRTARRFEQARHNSPVPYDELVELLAREGFRRGQALRTGNELTFREEPGHLAHARGTTFAWNPPPTTWAYGGADTACRIHELGDAVVVALNAAGTVMDAAAVEAFLRGYAAVLAAHADPTVDLRVTEAARLVGFTPPVPDSGYSSDDDPPSGAAAAPNESPNQSQRVLATVVRRVNGLGEVDLSDCYTVAGGRVLRIPQVLAMLREDGWDGLCLNQLAGVQPLRLLAGRLTRNPGG